MTNGDEPELVGIRTARSGAQLWSEHVTTEVGSLDLGPHLISARIAGPLLRLCAR